MISTAAYYCTRGHVWETTTNTLGHEEALNLPWCSRCAEELSPELGSVYGPFPNLSNAEFVMGMRGVVAAEDREEQEPEIDYMEHFTW